MEKKQQAILYNITVCRYILDYNNRAWNVNDQKAHTMHIKIRRYVWPRNAFLLYRSGSGLSTIVETFHFWYFYYYYYHYLRHLDLWSAAAYWWQGLWGMITNAAEINGKYIVHIICMREIGGEGAVINGFGARERCRGRLLRCFARLIYVRNSEVIPRGASFGHVPIRV